MKEDCIFCKIIAGKIPSTIVYKDEKVTAFKDVQPMAPVHILIVTNQHIDSINEATVGDETSLGTLIHNSPDHCRKGECQQIRLQAGREYRYRSRADGLPCAYAPAGRKTNLKQARLRDQIVS